MTVEFKDGLRKGSKIIAGVPMVTALHCKSDMTRLLGRPRAMCSIGTGNLSNIGKPNC